MARTIRPVASANLSDKERAAARARTKRKITALRRAARMLSSQEARALPSAKRGRARAPSETQEDTSDSETEEDDSASATRSAPPASSGYAKGVRRRSPAAAEAEQEEEEDGWADEARGIFRAHEGRRALVDGNEASDRAWLGKPHAPAARAVFRSIFPAAAKVEVDNAWLCDRV